MEIEVKRISELDFKKLNIHILFEDKLTDRIFGVVSNGLFSYKFGWQSDTLNPFILNVKGCVYLIGIDQNLVIFDFSKGEIILKSSLDYFFYEAKVYEAYIYVITELEILKIDLTTFNIIDKYGLPSYFERIEFKDGVAEIHCLDEEFLIIK